MTTPQPLITSLLDTDAYKLHMQQAVFHQYPKVEVGYVFCCRNKWDHLGSIAEEVREQIQLLSAVQLSDEEHSYLSSIPHFKADYIEYLRHYRFKPEQVEVVAVRAPTSSTTSHNIIHAGPANDGGEWDLSITVNGPWVETILWEIPLLAIVSEAAQRRRHPNIGVADAMRSLDRKLADFVKQHGGGEDLDTFHVVDFGTRRRFSREIQEAVVRTLSTDPRFKRHMSGTSNYDLARRLHLNPVGTQAHEWFQAFQQLSPDLRHSQRSALEAWLTEYPNALGIALTDCITMDAFLQDFNRELSTTFRGLRHDSGDPVEWGEKAMRHYESMSIPLKDKLLVFSDGLNLDSAHALHARFAPHVPVLFGIGTQLTCSIDGVKPLNIVLKMVSCEGRPVAKVSDSPGKTLCEDDGYIQKLMQAFNVQPAEPLAKAPPSSH